MDKYRLEIIVFNFIAYISTVVLIVWAIVKILILKEMPNINEHYYASLLIPILISLLAPIIAYFQNQEPIKKRNFQNLFVFNLVIGMLFILSLFIFSNK